MRSRANGARGLTAFALLMLSKCSLANIFYYYYKKNFKELTNTIANFAFFNVRSSVLYKDIARNVQLFGDVNVRHTCNIVP